ncbi:NUDIX domain-containing protein [Brachybacterium halotolerans subsp. kimchii]|uniref:NUDIX domain-containing protein n=1 Tax=Brachybacterium halotolerans TaxID=2795215 RepID=UPI001E55137A|nr:NUDIX domain-containing protein [Brachybacterium halotolerans]UEJ81749.1 NUDIX domain-containing protein [Brachybacterium halotolerans subsp. kimchii]
MSRGDRVEPHPAHALGPRVGVKALILRDGAILMNRSDVDGHEVFDLPGGGQEYGETQAEALVRECAEEIGARVRVHGVACVWEFLTEIGGFRREQIPLSHQLNVGFWCGLEPGEEPRAEATTEMDAWQVGTSWLPVDQLDRFDVRPRAIADWLQADPSIRPVGLGPVEL